MSLCICGFESWSKHENKPSYGRIITSLRIPSKIISDDRERNLMLVLHHRQMGRWDVTIVPYYIRSCNNAVLWAWGHHHMCDVRTELDSGRVSPAGNPLISCITYVGHICSKLNGIWIQSLIRQYGTSHELLFDLWPQGLNYFYCKWNCWLNKKSNLKQVRSDIAEYN